MTTDLVAPQDDVRDQPGTGRRRVRPAIDRLVPRPLQQQLIRFGAIGVLSTIAYGGLYLALRPLAGAFAANALALLLTAIANTALNRRVTFGVRGGSGLAGDHAVGLLAFGAGLALTTSSLAVLQATGNSSHSVELLVLTMANAVATLLRFVALKLRVAPARTGSGSARVRQ